MTPAETAARRADVLAYGVVNASSFDAPNTTLQWLFYTQTTNGWEEFHAGIVQIAW